MKFYDRIKERKENKRIDNEEKKLKKIKDKIQNLQRIRETQKRIKEQEQETKINIVPPKEEVKELTMIDRIEELKDILIQLSKPKESKDKKKLLKLPRKVKRQLKKLALKNKVIVFILRENRSAEMIVAEVVNGFVWIEGIAHNCANDFIFLFKGKYPCIVLPEWDLNPIGTKDYYDSIDSGRQSYPVATIMRLLEDKDVVKKGKMEAKTWIWIGIAVIAIIYLLAAS